MSSMFASSPSTSSRAGLVALFVVLATALGGCAQSVSGQPGSFSGRSNALASGPGFLPDFPETTSARLEATAPARSDSNQVFVARRVATSSRTDGCGR